MNSENGLSKEASYDKRKKKKKHLLYAMIFFASTHYFAVREQKIYINKIKSSV